MNNDISSFSLITGTRCTALKQDLTSINNCISRLMWKNLKAIIHRRRRWLPVQLEHRFHVPPITNFSIMFTLTTWINWGLKPHQIIDLQKVEWVAGYQFKRLYLVTLLLSRHAGYTMITTMDFIEVHGFCQTGPILVLQYNAIKVSRHARLMNFRWDYGWQFYNSCENWKFRQCTLLNDCRNSVQWYWRSPYHVTGK